MAASSSSEKAMEKQPPAVAAAAATATATAPAPAQMINKNSHVALSPELIEYMKNKQHWGERARRSYNEEKVRRVWEIQEKMDVNDLMHYVMYGDGKEVVWDDDVWNLQQITQIPEQAQPQGRPKTD